MTELSLTVLDIVENSCAAGADKIEIIIAADTKLDRLLVQINDNGRGMDKETLKSATDPFYTTRTTRRVGMGLPLIKMMCEDCGGSLTITSDNGIKLTAIMGLSSVDRPPLGDMGGTMMTLLHGGKNIRYILRYSVDENIYVFDTDEIKQVVGEDMTSPEILGYISEMINENIESINGGKVI